MTNLRFILPVLAACLLSIASCSKNNGPLTDEEAIDIAAHHLTGRSFDKPHPATVAFADGKYTVTFTWPVPGGNPGDTYTSKVVFDAKTREALEIEVGSPTAQPPEQASPAPDGRATPLGEEVDQVEALRRRMSRHQ